jgi:hypothetical protein
MKISLLKYTKQRKKMHITHYLFEQVKNYNVYLNILGHESALKEEWDECGMVMLPG